MKIGDMVRLVRTEKKSLSADIMTSINDSNCGVILEIKVREYSFGRRRIAVILHQGGQIQTWPLDSYYSIEVINGHD